MENIKIPWVISWSKQAKNPPQIKNIRKSFEKEQLLEETLVAESPAQLINLEHRSHLSSNSRGNSAASSGQSLPFVVPKDSFAFYQTQEPTKLLTQIHP